MISLLLLAASVKLCAPAAQAFWSQQTPWPLFYYRLIFAVLFVLTCLSQSCLLLRTKKPYLVSGSVTDIKLNWRHSQSHHHQCGQVEIDLCCARGCWFESHLSLLLRSETRTACVQSFAPWQQATIEIMLAISLTIACSCYIYYGVILHADPIRGESQRLQHYNDEVATL